MVYLPPNMLQVINNVDLFGGITNDSTVIVIQVHDRLEYLRYVELEKSQK